LPASPIHNPARFVPVYGVGFAARSGTIDAVSPASPLPVTMTMAETAQPVAGVATADMLAGPFSPTPGAPVIIVLAGDWAGEVRVSRSTDEGLTRHPLTAVGGSWARFTANACEPVWEEVDPAAQLYAEIAITSGTLDYRLGH
jgi:hypothetical protein